MPDPTVLPEEVRALLDRSNRLGSDPAVTNYGGGNTSAKVTVTSPASGEPVELLYVKGSGGDLGTLTADGLAVLERDRLVGLDKVYRGVEHEDEMVGLFAYCGLGTAVPRRRSTPRCTRWSTTRTSTICTRTASSPWPAPPTARSWSTRSGAGRWRGCRGSGPAGSSAGAMRELSDREGVIGAVLGGHGLTAWGSTSQEVEERSLRIIREAAALPRGEVGRPSRSARS